MTVNFSGGNIGRSQIVTLSHRFDTDSVTSTNVTTGTLNVTDASIVNLDVSNNITASKFIGDGSFNSLNVTDASFVNLDVTSLNVTDASIVNLDVTNNITASKFIGDGSFNSINVTDASFVNLDVSNVNVSGTFTGNLTGNVTSNTVNASQGVYSNYLNATRSVGTVSAYIDGNTGTLQAIYINASDTITGNVTGNVTGNADTATKIAGITNSNIVQLAETQTLTNKTLTSPTITSPTITGTGSITSTVFNGNLNGDVNGDVYGNLTGDVLIKHNFGNTSTLYPPVVGVHTLASIVGGLDGDSGGKLRFYTKASGGVLTERMKIEEDGNITSGNIATRGDITVAPANSALAPTITMGGTNGTIDAYSLTLLTATDSITAAGNIWTNTNITAIGNITAGGTITCTGMTCTGGIITNTIHAPTSGNTWLRLKGGNSWGAEVYIGGWETYYRANKHWFYARGPNNANMHPSSAYGGVFFNGNVKWSSDDRLKHNEVDVTNALATVRQLTAQKYQKTNEPKDADFNGELTEAYVEETGFIAQDVMAIPELAYCVEEGVTAAGKDIYYLNYNDIFVVNVQATKELDQIVQNQSKTIQALNTRLLSLESRLAALESP